MPPAQHIEELALNAWPSLQTVFVDGWIARLSHGYTKRANSVTPLYAGRQSLADKLSQCEFLFRQAGLPLIVRLPSFAAETPDIDAAMEERQFLRQDETLVQLLDLRRVSPRGSPQAMLTADEELNAWLQRYHAFSGSDPHPVHRHIVSLISGQRGFLTLMHNGAPVACGLGVVAAECLRILGAIGGMKSLNQDNLFTIK